MVYWTTIASFLVVFMSWGLNFWSQRAFLDQTEGYEARRQSDDGAREDQRRKDDKEREDRRRRYDFQLDARRVAYSTLMAQINACALLAERDMEKSKKLHLWTSSRISGLTVMTNG